jgi:hypothetical protein
MNCILGTAPGSMSPGVRGGTLSRRKGTSQILVGMSFGCQVQHRVDAILCPAMIPVFPPAQVSFFRNIHLVFSKDR